MLVRAEEYVWTGRLRGHVGGTQEGYRRSRGLGGSGNPGGEAHAGGADVGRRDVARLEDIWRRCSGIKISAAELVGGGRGTTVYEIRPCPTHIAAAQRPVADRRMRHDSSKRSPVCPMPLTQPPPSHCLRRGNLGRWLEGPSASARSRSWPSRRSPPAPPHPTLRMGTAAGSCQVTPDRLRPQCPGALLRPFHLPADSRSIPTPHGSCQRTPLRLRSKVALTDGDDLAPAALRGSR